MVKSEEVDLSKPTHHPFQVISPYGEMGALSESQAVSCHPFKAAFPQTREKPKGTTVFRGEGFTS